jgi:hypothetical protein
MLPRPFRSCPFSFPIPHHSVRLSLIPLSVFPLIFFFAAPANFFLCISWLAPADEAAEMVPLSSQFQRDGSYTVGFVRSRTLALRQKNFVLSYLLLSSRPRVYRSLGKSLERTFSLFPFGLQPDKFPSLFRPLLFFLTTQFHFCASKILERTCRFSIFSSVGSR